MKKLLILIVLLIPAVASAKPKKNTDPISCMAENIYREAGTENSLGQLAVAYTVLNRLKTHKYGDNVCDVIYHKCQYAWTCQTHSRFDISKHEEIELLARRVMFNMFQDPTAGSVSFNNRPFKTRYLQFTMKIGKHYFYKSTTQLATRNQPAL
jgi:spore germination cell wall hydrolase CwlJ-like protein